MADIFVSYSHQDADCVRDIATALEDQGWSVWWDPAIRSGESFVSLINREISAASCVVVLWSKASVVSRWVLEEAHNGLNRGILCPVVIDRDVQLPVGFATIKYLPLWDWRNRAPVGGYGPLFNELTRVVGPPARTAPPTPPSPAPAMPPQRPEVVAPPTPSPPQVERHERAPSLARPPSTEDRFIDFSDVSWIDYPVVALFLIPFALLLTDLFGRYLLSHPLMGAYELTSFSGGLAALFGAAVALRNNRNIRSPASLLLLRGTLSSVVAPLRPLLSCAVFTVMAYALFLQAMTSLRIGEVSVSPIGIPLPPVRFAIAVAFALMALFSLFAFWRAVVRKGQQ
jgi:TRAP-type C4-dicarboxylate transport system permease small subunit